MADTSIIEMPYWKIRTNGLVLARDIPLETWIQVGTLLAKFERATSWALGDWLLHGESRPDWGERYSQAMEATELDYNQLANAKYVAQAFAQERRRDALTWSHHREVVGLEPAAQDEWLTKAESEGWTVRQLRVKVKEAGGEKKESGGGSSKSDPPPAFAEEGAVDAAKRQYLLLSNRQKVDFRLWLSKELEHETQVASELEQQS